MLTNYFGVSGVVGWVGLLVAGVGLAGMYSGAFALWLSWMARRRLVFPWLVAAAWGTCEFARANPFIGTPWALVGYSQTSWTRLMQIADATGPYGVGMLIAAVNACLAGAITPLLRGRRFAVSCVLVGVAMGGALIYGEWRLTQTFASGDPVPVAVVQGAIERKLRWDPERREANLGLYFALTKETAPVHPRLIFWPENAVDFYLQEAVPESEAVLRITRDLGTSLILGGPYYGHGVTGRYYHNSVFLIRKGRMTDRYDKIRLLPFAETGQFKEIFPKKPLNLKPGRRFQTLRAEDLRVGAFICFEAMYPDLVRSFALQGAEVLVNPSNDDWFDSAASARHQLDIAAVRAIENRRYLIRPTATGFSAIIDPYGRTVVRSGFGAPEVLTASVYPSRVRTPYQQWGDATAWGAVMFVAFASLFLLLTKDDKNDEGGKL
jgi:apolipoprotein N-acyltransferase